MSSLLLLVLLVLFVLLVLLVLLLLLTHQARSPWRAPGSAPNTDACGMAGGTPKAQGNGGQYPNTKFAKQVSPCHCS